MNRQSQWLFEAPFVDQRKMNRQNHWLFEAPLTSEVPHDNNPYVNSEYHSDLELEAEWESPAVVLRSGRFRGDQRLQAAANNNPALRVGERGSAVQKLQQALIDLGYPMPVTTKKGAPDGIYGSETAATVRKFQSKYGLAVDGIAGQDTLRQLDQLFLLLYPPVPPSPGTLPKPPTPPPLATPPSTPPPASAQLTRVCCMLAPKVNPLSFSSTSNLVDPTALGTHGDTWWSGKEALGLIYTGRAGFLDLAHIRDSCDLTKYVYDQIVAVQGVPVIIQTFHGTATIHTPVPSSAWIQVAREISYDDSIAYEIFTYDNLTPGGHNSSFSPEDLCSNYLGTLLAEKAILAGGPFNAAVTSELGTMVGLLNAQTVAESLKAFNLINNCWVSFSGVESCSGDTYLKRRNFDRIPWFAGHPSDSPPPAWVTAGFGNATTTFYTFTSRFTRWNRSIRTIDKADFQKEIADIKKDAAKRYGDRFGALKCP